MRHQQKEEQEAETGKKDTTTANEVFLREFDYVSSFYSVDNAY